MRTGRRFRGWVTAAALGVGAVPALAQSPAARLVPIDPNTAPAPPVARSAYPDIPDADVYPVPVQGYAGQPTITPPTDPSRSWIGGAWSGVKEFVVGKPVSAETPAPATPPSVGLPQPRPVPPTVPMPVPPAAQPTAPQATYPPAAPQPGVYAGPPAYRWYGWGTTTPGANQYAPHGLYPKGSANWHAHTGATPGAFPVPIQYPAARPGVEPPAYTGNPHTYDAAYVAPSGSALPEPDPEPVAPAQPRRAALSQPTVEPPPAPREFPLPSMPRVATPAAPTVEPDWRMATPLPTQAPAVAPVKRPRAPLPSPSEPMWLPAATHPGTVVPAAATAPLARGQQQPSAPDVATRIRAACISRVNQVRVTPTGERALTVTFITTTEQLAREAADLVSRLPAVRPYAVRFEVQLTK